MPRLPVHTARTLLRPTLLTTVHPTRTFAFSSLSAKGAQNSRPGWEGRSGDHNSKTGDDHAVNRDGLDAQSKESQTALKQRQKVEEGKNVDDTKAGQGVTRKDETNSAQKTREEFPEAPDGPIIGMNDERGGVSVVSFLGSICVLDVEVAC